MPVTVQGPDGQTYQFPDGTTKDTAVSYFRKKGIGTRVAGLPSGEKLPGQPDVSSPTLSKMQNTDTTGALRSAWEESGIPAIPATLRALKNDPAAVARGIGGSIKDQTRDWALRALTGKKQSTLQQLETAPIIGSTIERAANQYGGGNTPGALGSISGIPLGMLGMEGINKGVQIGAGGLKKIAPVLAETALRVRGADRAYGAQPGKAILEETTGITPRAVAQSAQDTLEDLTNEKSRLAAQSSERVDLSRPREIASEARSGAASRNNKGTIKDVDELYNQLHTEHGTGGPVTTWDGRRMVEAPKSIPSSVTAKRAVDLQRGLGDLRDFSPAARSTFADQATGRAYHQLGEGINQAVPEIVPLNQRTSSLIPVAKRATAADLNAGFLQRLSGRAAAHTGALAAGGIGYATHGIPGLLTGIAVPEIVSSPEFQMAFARGANKAGGILGKIPRIPVGPGIASLNLLQSEEK